MRSKNSLIRERVIDSCLSDKTRRWSMLEIMDAVNQALREQCEEEVTALNTIRDDIRAIETRCHDVSPLLPQAVEQPLVPVRMQRGIPQRDQLRTGSHSGAGTQHDGIQAQPGH